MERRKTCKENEWGGREWNVKKEKKSGGKGIGEDMAEGQMTMVKLKD